LAAGHDTGVRLAPRSPASRRHPPDSLAAGHHAGVRLAPRSPASA